MAASTAPFPPTSGLALDWSKCYDHLILDLLETVGNRVGIPPALLRPMLAAYRQPRSVLLGGALAAERRPTMKRVHHGVVSRPYVDDISSDITDPEPALAVEIVGEMVEFTNMFARDLEFEPKLVKSQRFPPMRRSATRSTRCQTLRWREASLTLEWPILRSTAPLLSKASGCSLG